MKSLYASLVDLGTTNPELRPHIRPLLRVAMEFPSPDALQKYLKEHPGADKSKHSVKDTEENRRRQEDDTRNENLSRHDLREVASAANDFMYMPKEFRNDMHREHKALGKVLDAFADDKEGSIPKDPSFLKELGSDLDKVEKKITADRDKRLKETQGMGDYFTPDALKQHIQSIKDNAEKGLRGIAKLRKLVP